MSDVDFAGDKFRMAERIGLMPLMRFAKIAKAGVDSTDLDGLAALYDLLEQCIAEDEWQRFQNAADKARADGDQLMQVVKDVFEALSGRPTSRPSDSSGGPTTTPPNSEDDLSLRVVKRLEDEGRPDQAYMVLMAQRASSAA